MFSGLLILGGRHSGKVLEVFAEARLICEIKLVSYLLNILAGEPQEVLCLKHNKFIYPLSRAPAGGFLDYKRKVFRRDKELGCIERYRALPAMVLMHEPDKIFHIT